MTPTLFRMSIIKHNGDALEVKFESFNHVILDDGFPKTVAKLFLVKDVNFIELYEDGSDRLITELTIKNKKEDY